MATVNNSYKRLVCFWQYTIYFCDNLVRRSLVCLPFLYTFKFSVFILCSLHIEVEFHNKSRQIPFTSYQESHIKESSRDLPPYTTFFQRDLCHDKFIINSPALHLIVRLSECVFTVRSHGIPRIPHQYIKHTCIVRILIYTPGSFTGACSCRCFYAVLYHRRYVIKSPPIQRVAMCNDTFSPVYAYIKFPWRIPFVI